MRNSAIGIFDSGIGGLTVANAIKKILPNENIIYFGDTEHLPYGEKSKKAIQSFSNRIINFLINKNCKIIVIACNSASSVAEKTLADISTSTSVLNVIDPVVTEVAKICSKQNIGVIGTKATIKSGIYEKKIRAMCCDVKISSLATPLLAPMIEEGFINESISNTLINNYLSNSKLADIDHLILACTHYPLIQKTIKNYYSDSVEMIDSANIVAKHVKNQLREDDLLNKNKATKHHFYVSNYTQSFERSAKFFFKEDVKLKEINLFG